MAALRASAAPSCAREKSAGRIFLSLARLARASEAPLLSNRGWRLPGNPIPAPQRSLRKADCLCPLGQTCSQTFVGAASRRCSLFLWAFLTVFVQKAPEALPNSRAMEVAIPKDLQQEASLAKKRYMDLCRQGQIFDARNRIIGVRHLERDREEPRL